MRVFMKKRRNIRREMTSQWFNQRPELDGKVRKPSQTTSTWRFGTLPGSLWIIAERKATFAVGAASPSASGRALRLHTGDLRLLRRQVMHARRTLMNSVTASVPVYLSNQPLDRRNESPVWRSVLSLYNFRPHFPQRPLNLTAIWWFAAITVHSWVKINLWDSSLGQGFEDTLDFVLVTITYCDSSICRRYPSYNLRREHGQGIQYHPAKIQGRGKNRNSTTWRPSDQK